MVVCAIAAPAAGQQMPSAAQMSGVPLPASDLAAGAVSVRLVRGDVSNNIAGHPIELHGGPSVLTVTTDASGRAQFTGLTPGTSVHAVAVVGGQRLESQVFSVPAQGGLKVMLVAPDAATDARAAESAKLATSAPQPGAVTLSGQSQFVVELADDEREVFYLLQIANTLRTPVEAAPLVFDLPPGARGATVLEGSSPLARAEGPRVIASGPFPPGSTVVQMAYQMPYSGDRVTIAQKMPATLESLSIAAQKVGGMHLTSPQMANHGEMPSDGRTYLVATGPAIRAGDSLTFTVTGLPHRAAWPRITALVAAVVILLVGAWASVSVGGEARAAAARRRKLQERRDRLFADLMRIEQKHRTGVLDDPRYAARRRDLVAELERLYGELDEGLAA
jgi:hypothetical protein